MVLGNFLVDHQFDMFLLCTSMAIGSIFGSNEILQMLHLFANFKQECQEISSSHQNFEKYMDVHQKATLHSYNFLLMFCDFIMSTFRSFNITYPFISVQKALNMFCLGRVTVAILLQHHSKRLKQPSC